jgi:hypothetical protein
LTNKIVENAKLICSLGQALRNGLLVASALMSGGEAAFCPPPDTEEGAPVEQPVDRLIALLEARAGAAAAAMPQGAVQNEEVSQEIVGLLNALEKRSFYGLSKEQIFALNPDELERINPLQVALLLGQLYFKTLGPQCERKKTGSQRSPF